MYTYKNNKRKCFRNDIRKKQEGEFKTEIKRRQLIGKTNGRMIRRRTMYGQDNGGGRGGRKKLMEEGRKEKSRRKMKGREEKDMGRGRGKRRGRWDSEEGDEEEEEWVEVDVHAGREIKLRRRIEEHKVEAEGGVKVRKEGKGRGGIRITLKSYALSPHEPPSLSRSVGKVDLGGPPKSFIARLE